MDRLFTSESVTEGHPDKVCDNIADAILDEILKQDPKAHVACEVCICKDKLLIMGEISGNATVDMKKIAKDVIRDIGYDKSNGFDIDNCEIIISVSEQSADIAQGVNGTYFTTDDKYEKVGAGDQGMMFGYACRETNELMPMPIMLAHALTKRLTEVRKSGELKYLRPDGKAQVTVEYENDKPVHIGAVVVSTQHDEDVDMDTLKNDIFDKVISYVLPTDLFDKDTEVFINPTGRFVIGGPLGDSGLTGRKIVVDTYGGYCPHGGGSFSGKDATKVDRSATYMARYVCKNVVAAGLADKCLIEIAYAIGRAKPVSVHVDTFKTGKFDDLKIRDIIIKEFDLRPLAIIEKLNLQAPVYKSTASYGHFGNESYAWEKTDMVDKLRKYLN